jgi:hypothetical protein
MLQVKVSHLTLECCPTSQALLVEYMQHIQSTFHRLFLLHHYVFFQSQYRVKNVMLVHILLLQVQQYVRNVLLVHILMLQAQQHVYRVVLVTMVLQ